MDHSCPINVVQYNIEMCFITIKSRLFGCVAPLVGRWIMNCIITVIFPFLSGGKYFVKFYKACGRCPSSLSTHACAAVQITLFTLLLVSHGDCSVLWPLQLTEHQSAPLRQKM